MKQHYMTEYPLRSFQHWLSNEVKFERTCYLPSLKQIHIEEFVELHGEFYHSLNFTHVYEDEEVKTCQHLGYWKQRENKLFRTEAEDNTHLI